MRLRERGLTVAEIAQALGKDKRTVQRYLKSRCHWQRPQRSTDGSRAAHTIANAYIRIRELKEEKVRAVPSPRPLPQDIDTPAFFSFTLPFLTEQRKRRWFAVFGSTAGGRWVRSADPGCLACRLRCLSCRSSPTRGHGQNGGGCFTIAGKGRVPSEAERSPLLSPPQINHTKSAKCRTQEREGRGFGGLRHGNTVRLPLGFLVSDWLSVFIQKAGRLPFNRCIPASSRTKPVPVIVPASRSPFRPGFPPHCTTSDFMPDLMPAA